jgi:CRP-like cAMP-binding protein
MGYHSAETGQTVFHYGEASDKFYVILKGEVSIKIRVAQTLTKATEETSLE